MAPGARSKLAPLCNLRPFGSKYTVLKKVSMILLELFGARGVVPLLPLPRYGSGYVPDSLN